MQRARRFADTLRRSAHAGVALLRSTASRPSAPLKLNFCLTYWCQYRCKTCNIWQRKPTDELTTDEVITFIRRNPNVTWVDLTGGEIFLRPDIDDILEAVVTGWRRLALLHFPTNGFLTDRIVESVRRIAGRGPGQTIITVSVDGDEQLNDDIRGIKGGYSRQVATFNALRGIPGITVVFGVTLSKHNLGRFTQTFDALARIHSMGPETVILSLGSRGALASSAEGVFEVVPPRVDALCPIGAGDAMAAAFLWALEKKKTFPDALRWAVATGTATAILPGTNFPTLDQAKAIYQNVEVRQVS